MIIQGYSKDFKQRILDIQLDYERGHPHAERFTADDFGNPLLNGRKNILLAIDNGRVQGFSRFFSRQNFSREFFHHIWLEIILENFADPKLMSALYEASIPAIIDSTKGFFPAAGTRICVKTSDTEKTKRDFFSSAGFTHWIDLDYMERDMSEEISYYRLPEGLRIAKLKPRREPEILQYLRVEQICFPDSPLEYKYLNYFFSKAEWKREGVIIAATDAKENIVGSVMVYPDIHNDDKCYTEEIFVVQEWRGRGLARALLATSLTYLKSLGKTRAILSVTSDRTSAKKIYEEAGFKFQFKRKVLALEI
ncbi:MAG: GNAT family N-acetyltransferase [Kosmotogaceae bacterium]|nr:GNAT family N-acetyltransferase [Kosmotogaceae bacterium]